MSNLPKDTKLLEVDGHLRLVAENYIGENSLIGLAYIKVDREVHQLAAGAFLTDNDNPNCMLQTNQKGKYYLWAIKDIFIHDPLTIDFRLYDI